MPASDAVTCRVVRARSRSYEGRQGLSYFEGISRETVGAERLCLHLLVIPPGGRAKAHLHERHETAIYLLSGVADVWFGADLKEYARVETGDFFYIPAGVPHLPANPSASEPCQAVIARTDSNEPESVGLLPDLDPH
ncbi:MAG TPA: cupin domain-containing protein [Chloroflexota bacterium]